MPELLFASYASIGDVVLQKEATEWVNTVRILLQELKGDVTVSIGDVHATDRQDTTVSTLSTAESGAQEVGHKIHVNSHLVSRSLNYAKTILLLSDWLKIDNGDVNSGNRKQFYHLATP